MIVYGRYSFICDFEAKWHILFVIVYTLHIAYWKLFLQYATQFMERSPHDELTSSKLGNQANCCFFPSFFLWLHCWGEAMSLNSQLMDKKTSSKETYSRVHVICNGLREWGCMGTYPLIRHTVSAGFKNS